jgi:succinate dehydrogenase / fumarate reductase iron-sulfur subunit
MFPVPGRLSCTARPSQARGIHRPAIFVFAAALEMHPLDTEDRLSELKQAGGIGYCNITKCCTKVCPENITITDNAIIPLKERVVDEFYDSLRSLLKLFRPKT